MTDKQLEMANGYTKMGKINLQIANEFMNSKAEQKVINIIKEGD